MIEDGAVERFGGGGKAAGDGLVAVARPRIAAGVVMRQDEAHAAVAHGIGDDRPQRKVRAAFVPRMVGQMDAARFGIEVRDEQMFASGRQIVEASREEGAGGGEAVELERKFGTLMKHGREAMSGAIERPREPHRIRTKIPSTTESFPPLGRPPPRV